MSATVQKVSPEPFHARSFSFDPRHCWLFCRAIKSQPSTVTKQPQSIMTKTPDVMPANLHFEVFHTPLGFATYCTSPSRPFIIIFSITLYVIPFSFFVHLSISNVDTVKMYLHFVLHRAQTFRSSWGTNCLTFRLIQHYKLTEAYAMTYRVSCHAGLTVCC